MRSKAELEQDRIWIEKYLQDRLIRCDITVEAIYDDDDLYTDGPVIFRMRVKVSYGQIYWQYNVPEYLFRMMDEDNRIAMMDSFVRSIAFHFGARYFTNGDYMELL